MENITKRILNCSSISFDNCSTNLSTNAEKHIDPVLQKASDIILIVLMVLIMLSLGCTIELSVLKQEIRRPIGVAIGLLCQFILFPAVTFGLAHALRLQQWDALGMIMLGTCPGGSISNLATYWSNGDVVLSVIMTAASTAIGTGMMPLNLWIYSRSWTDKKAVIPYVNIVIALLSILIPVAIGMAIVYKFPKQAKWITKIGSLMGIIAIAAAVVLNVLMYSEIYTSTAWATWFGAGLLPCVGLAIGYGLAFIARRPISQRRAIAIETSSQNAALCLTLISFTFKGENVSRMNTYPTLFACFSMFILTAISVFFQLCDHHTKRKYKHHIKRDKKLEIENNQETIENGLEGRIVTFSRV